MFGHQQGGAGCTAEPYPPFSWWCLVSSRERWVNYPPELPEDCVVVTGLLIIPHAA